MVVQYHKIKYQDSLMHIKVFSKITGNEKGTNH